MLIRVWLSHPHHIATMGHPNTQSKVQKLKNNNHHVFFLPFSCPNHVSLSPPFACNETSKACFTMASITHYTIVKHAFDWNDTFFHFLETNFAPILDVGLLTVVGVSCEASVQLAHLQAISCSPTLRWSMTKRRLLIW
jgi:hypothetical protein